MNKARRHAFFLIPFGTLFLWLSWPLWTMTRGLVRGDYALQAFPWMLTYARALKHGMLPLWTPLIQCGFPLFAEGQAGMLYWPNLVMFRLLPFVPAYNLMFLLHFIAGGVFAYLFGLRRGMSAGAAALVALCFSFGSMGAGAFLNVFSLRALAFFPLLLLLVDEYTEKRKVWALFALALVQGQAWLAGSPQMALYQAAFTFFYYEMRTWENGFRAKEDLLLLAALALSVVIGLPQLWATQELAAHSTRLLQEKSFVLWGSVSPLAAGTLVMPALDPLLRCHWYVGIIPIFLIALCPQWSQTKGLWALFFFAVFMSLGAFNPLYWLLIQLPFVSMLRDPSRFIFFAAFFLAVIGGHSLDAFLRACREDDRVLNARLLKRAFGLAMLMTVFALAVWGVAEWGRPVLERLGEWYVQNFVQGKSFHRSGASEHSAKLVAILDWIKANLHWDNPIFVLPVALSVASAGAVVWIVRKKLRSGTASAILLLILFVDLGIYAGLMKGTSSFSNIGSFDETLLKKELPRDGRWMELRQGKERLLPPNRSMISEHSQIGAYSPLIDKEYYLLVKDLGVIDDSFGASRPDALTFKSAKPLLDFLSVKYVISLEGQAFVNDEARGEFSLAAGTQHHYDKVDIGLREWDEVSLTVRAEEPSLLVWNQVYDRGWKVRVDGRETATERADRAFQGVRVPAGEHKVEYRYQPESFFTGRWFHLAGMAIALLGLFIFRPKRRAA